MSTSIKEEEDEYRALRNTTGKYKCAIVPWCTHRCKDTCWELNTTGDQWLLYDEVAFVCFNVHSLSHCRDLDSEHTHGFSWGHPLQAKLSAGELHGKFNLDLTQEKRAYSTHRFTKCYRPDIHLQWIFRIFRKSLHVKTRCREINCWTTSWKNYFKYSSLLCATIL